MGKDVAKSKGNFGRRAGQRNKGIPHGVKSSGSHATLSNADSILASASTLFESSRRLRMFNRWNVAFGKSETTRAAQ